MHGHGGQEGIAGDIARRATRAQQHGKVKIARLGLPDPPGPAPPRGLPPGEDGEAGGLAPLGEFGDEALRAGKGLVDPEAEPAHPISAATACRAAAMSGAGKRKKKSVKAPVPASTTETPVGRRSKAGLAASKYITFTMRR